MLKQFNLSKYGKSDEINEIYQRKVTPFKIYV